MTRAQRKIVERGHAWVQGHAAVQQWVSPGLVLDLVQVAVRQDVLLRRYRKWMKTHAALPHVVRRQLEQP